MPYQRVVAVVKSAITRTTGEYLHFAERVMYAGVLSFVLGPLFLSFRNVIRMAFKVSFR